ncbi:MAG: hypothetical protein OXF83_04050 [Anaerolineaceae bacterium]|nr:hypothetical protein [Anaerolineaceae bacterium]MCY3936224.1 hypothetical protein [Chloroflexota bacterium]MCY4010053.1 hypothetical protein [Anaerolineaceae bacterium]MCY4107153.1 hypothetical protein [Chloroflexota bacterium]
MLKRGDRIVHIRHGAGIVQGMREMTFDGNQRQYYCIRLLASHGEVMLPIDSMEENEIRTDIVEEDFIRQVMNLTPEILANDYKVRQANIRRQLTSGTPSEIVQALRDLCWRERYRPLTSADSELKLKALRLVKEELALKLQIDIEEAAKRLNDIIADAMISHQQVADASQNLN